MTDEGERGSTENATTGDEPVDSGGAPSSQNPGLVRLRWLKINQYRNVRPTTLRFDDNFNVVLGMNGAGKTTLLKLLAAVISCKLDLVQGQYDVEYELVSGSVEIRARAWTQPTEVGFVSLDILSHPKPTGGLGDLDQPALERHFEASVRGVRAAERWVLSVGPQLALLDSGGPEERQVPQSWRTSGVAMELAVMAVMLGDRRLLAMGVDSAWSARMLALMHTARRFDESLETLHSICAADGDPELLECPLVYAFDRRGLSPHFAVAGHGNGGFWSKFPPALAEVGAHALHVPLGLAVPMSDLSLEFGLDVAMAVEFLRKDRAGAELAWQWRGLSFAVSLPGGQVLTQDALSYGQKRLLTFLYYLAVNDYVVIADELVNGLHHSWIKLCLDQIGQRQAFLTSQNPILLDYLPPADVEQARKQFIVCRTERTAAGEQLVWENMSEESAERVMSAYGVGIQSLSEVLESKGLW